jgi:protein-S-isoprenylcysteine O-methyltransferase Ste14
VAALPRIAIPALWAAWLILWLVLAPFAKPARWREPVWVQLVDRGPLFLCALLLLPGTRHWWPTPLLSRFWPRGQVLPSLGTALVAAGLAFAVWARFHLGRNWSGRVAVKQNHALVASGPYAIVRHPIYLGLLGALLGTALAVGEWRALLAVAVAFTGFLRRIAAEERRMRETFAEYEAYRRITPALFPRLLRR